LTTGAAPLAGCTVSQAKITNYLLDAAHGLGGAKARFFSAVGFSTGDWQAMATALTDHPVRNSVESRTLTPYGAKYVVRCTLETPDGRDPCVVTVWIKDSAAPPRLVTAYPA
jgi:hypothetical protein